MSPSLLELFCHKATSNSVEMFKTSWYLYLLVYDLNLTISKFLKSRCFINSAPIFCLNLGSHIDYADELGYPKKEIVRIRLLLL